MCGTLQQVPWTFAGLSRIFRKTCSKIAQPTPNAIGLHHPQHRQRINNASIGDAYLPGHTRERCLQMCKCTGMPPRTQRGIYRKKSFLRELHRRSFAEGFNPRRKVTEHTTPCKDLLINPHLSPHLFPHALAGLDAVTRWSGSVSSSLPTCFLARLLGWMLLRDGLALCLPTCFHLSPRLFPHALAGLDAVTRLSGLVSSRAC